MSPLWLILLQHPSLETKTSLVERQVGLNLVSQDKMRLSQTYNNMQFKVLYV